MITPAELAKMIDHTNLKPAATGMEIGTLCREALAYEFASVCVNPVYVPVAANLLADSGVKVCTVIGFPLGANTAAVKAYEASEAVKAGAEEIDMVINVGALKGGHTKLVKDEIQAVVDAALKVDKKVLVKVILETALLSDSEIKTGCELTKEAGAHFVKTSTGFGPGGAAAEVVALMRKTVGESMGVKASGGIRTHEDATAMLEAGANRIGASAGVDIVENYIVATGQYPVVSNMYK